MTQPTINSLARRWTWFWVLFFVAIAVVAVFFTRQGYGNGLAQIRKDLAAIKKALDIPEPKPERQNTRADSRTELRR